MQVIPALDLLGTDAVRLEMGDFDRVLFRQPIETFMSAIVETRPALIHIVDLQGARDGAIRPEIIARCQSVAEGTPLQISGGIRTVESAKQALAAGATRVIVGTAVWENDAAAMDDFVGQLGSQLLVAVDIKDGRLATKGWLEDASLSVSQAVARCRDAGVTRLHVTAVERDGTMRGPDLELYEEACSFGIPVVAAGGVRDDDDVRALEEVGCEAAVMGVGYLARLGITLEDTN